MTLLVFGKTGQVAIELKNLAPHAIFLGRDEADLRDPDGCGAIIRSIHPTAVINAAAHTCVDRAEEQEALARIINGEAPPAMARACAALNVPFIHISTDYVFSGSGAAPWRPTDPVAPQNAYGRTKLAGEVGICAAGGAHAILRTSWVVSAHGSNFVKTMLRLSQTCKVLSIVDDQIGGPTPARDIAAACLQMAEQLRQDPKKSGTYHFSGAPDTSWSTFAEAIFALVGRQVTVAGIPSSSRPTPAMRPLNSRLDCSETDVVFGIARPNWQAGIKQILRDLGEIK